MNLESVLENGRNLIQIVFQLIASYVAIVGLRSWIIQLKGKTEYEAAKNVLVGAYRIRDEIKRCQGGFLIPSEWAEHKPTEGESEQSKQVGESHFAYTQRYNRVINALNDWYPAIVEAEALFGEEARLVISKLQDCCTRLRAAINIYHRALYRGEESDRTEKYFNIIQGLTASTGFDDDNFQQDLDDAVQGIQKFFSKYIISRHPLKSNSTQARFNSQNALSARLTALVAKFSPLTHRGRQKNN